MIAWLEEARLLIGEREIRGAKHNPRIVEMFADVGHDDEADETAWCAAFAGACLKRNGMRIPDPSVNLMARSYLKVGTKLAEPTPGAIVVKARGKPPFGHVGIVEEVHADGTFTVIAGNSSNKVSREKWKPTDPLPNGIRWPQKIAEKPPIIKPIGKTAVKSKSFWSQISAMVLVLVGYVTDWLHSAFEWTLGLVVSLPQIVGYAGETIESGMQISDWFQFDWSKIGIGVALGGMAVALVRHVLDKARVEWD